MKTLAFLLPLFRRQRLPFAGALALSLTTLLAGIALLGVSGWFLTAAALTTLATSFNLFGPSSLIRGLSLVRILSRYGEKLMGHDATLRLLSDMRTHVFSRLFVRLPFGKDSMTRGDLVSRLTSDIDALEAIFIVGIAPLITSVLAGLATAVVMGLVLPKALVFYGAAMGCAVVVVPALLFLVCRRLGGRQVALGSDTRCQLLNALDGHSDLVAFGRIASAQRGFDHACRRLGDLRRQLALRASLAATAIQLLMATALLSVMITGISALRAEDIGGPVLVGLLLATLASFEGAAAVVRGVARFGTALAAAERVGNLAKAVPPLGGTHLPMPAGSRLISDNVGFGHDITQPILRNFSLTVEPGERIALVGRSGCGKSTFLSLLVGLNRVQSGEIRLDGVDITGLDPDALGQRIVLLEQDAPAFMGTIRNNLLIGDPDADDIRLMDALASVKLENFVRGLPEGLDTYVGETGRTLSIGQIRRLCLVRVLLSKADILLLDEPTSSLEKEMEAAFFADLARIADGRTIIVATHAPLSALDGFDRRYQMQSGVLTSI